MNNIENDENVNDLITESERKKLLAALHTRLFWVGEKIPEVVDIDDKQCKVHELVWSKINKEKLNDIDKSDINSCIEKLRKKQKIEESKLETENITVVEANRIANEAGGLLRAIMDLKEIEDGTSKENEKKFHNEFSKQRTQEIRRWLNFIEDINDT